MVNAALLPPAGKLPNRTQMTQMIMINTDYNSSNPLNLKSS